MLIKYFVKTGPMVKYNEEHKNSSCQHFWNFKKGSVLKSIIHQQMYTVVLHTVYVLKFQIFSAPRRSAQGVQ